MSRGQQWLTVNLKARLQIVLVQPVVSRYLRFERLKLQFFDTIEMLGIA